MKEYPEGTVDDKLGLYVCDECGYWENEERLDFYVPVEGEKPYGKDLSRIKDYGKYILLKRFKHICPRCQSGMREILNSQAAVRDAHLECPKCHKEIRIDSETTLTDVKKEYHYILLAYIADSISYGDSNILIPRLSENVKIYSTLEDVAIIGIEDAKEFLFNQAKKQLKKQNLYEYSFSEVQITKCVNNELISPGTLSQTNSCAILVLYDGNKEAVCTGEINEFGIIDYLLFFDPVDVEYTIVNEYFYPIGSIL